MNGSPTHGSSTVRRRSVADRLGFRRVEYVEIVVDRRGRRAYVTGTTHRLPHTVPVPWSLAAELIAAGVPVRTAERQQ